MEDIADICFGDNRLDNIPSTDSGRCVGIYQHYVLCRMGMAVYNGLHALGCHRDDWRHASCRVESGEGSEESGERKVESVVGLHAHRPHLVVRRAAYGWLYIFSILAHCNVYGEIKNAESTVTYRNLTQLSISLFVCKHPYILIPNSVYQ